MAQNRLCVKRGNRQDLSSLMPGEPAYSIDTNQLHIGNVSGDSNLYLNSDQIASKISTVKNELLTQITSAQTNIEQIVKGDGVKTDLHLSQRQLAQNGLKLVVPGIVLEKTNTNIVFANRTVYTVHFEVILLNDVELYYLCGCHDVGTSPNKGWYLAATSGKLLFCDAATGEVSEILTNAIKALTKFNLTLTITNGTSVQIFINNIYVSDFSATTLSTVAFVLNASRLDYQKTNAPLLLNAFIYNRDLTNKELLYSKQVISTYQAINSINDVPILMNANHILNDEAVSLEQFYTDFLKNNCFNYTSTNGNLLIEKSIKNSKLLKLKIIGKTVGTDKVNAILEHNSISYSFYANLVDKENDRVIQLGIDDTLEIFEDGTCALTQNTIVTPIPQSLVPLIVLEETNQFFVKSEVVPSEFSITVPINQVAHIEELLTELESKTSALATLIMEDI